MHGWPSARRHADCRQERSGQWKHSGRNQSLPQRRVTDLSESHHDGLWESWEGLGLGVVLQEDAAALENHVRLAVNDQRALVGLEAHSVAELPAVGRHLGE